MDGASPAKGRGPRQMRPQRQGAEENERVEHEEW